MKTLIIASAFLGSIAFAQADVVSSSNFTCAALQQYVAASGTAGAEISQTLGSGVYYGSASDCASGYVANGAYVFGTQDQTACFVGFVCDKLPNTDGN